MNTLQTQFPGFLSAVHAAEHGSFTAAARILALTPAAVSKNVASLEAQLGVRLFNRTTRRLHLTEEGASVIAKAREGLTCLQHAGNAAAQGIAPAGVVRVSCSHAFGKRYVLPYVAAFYEAYAEVSIDLSLNDATVDLVREGFDVGIRGGSEPPPGMVSRRICPLPAALVATSKYLKARGTPASYRELETHDLLRVRFLSGQVTPWLFRERGRTVRFDPTRVRLHLSDADALHEAALMHLGIARVGRHHAFDALQRGQLVEVLASSHIAGDAAMNIYFPHRDGLAPRVRVWVDFLLAKWKKEPALMAKA
jgi:DNA-binding transcriptional LysR family regulator